MTLNIRSIPWTLVALLGVAGSAHAWPTTSPSAKLAARLKYHPPDNWLQHYLPDDRYKIAGGIWKVVSTQYDTYYHRPDSQYMLRQPAGIVIGFANEKEAQDAGYRAEGGYFAGGRGSNRGPANGKVIVGSGRSKVTVKGNRVLLSDGSSVLLPTGWTLNRGKLTTMGKTRFGFDMLMRGSDHRKLVTYMYVDSPGTNMGSNVNPAMVRKMVADSGKNMQAMTQMGGEVTNRFDGIAAAAKNSNVSAKSLGGMAGVAVRQNLPTGSYVAMAGRGSAMYTFMTRNDVFAAPEARAILQSFRPA